MVEIEFMSCKTMTERNKMWETVWPGRGRAKTGGRWKGKEAVTEEVSWALVIGLLSISMKN